jgi:hypothetical protein
MVDHFYLTLLSDSSGVFYPNNEIARYVTKLPERIRLEGDYEVGLSELVYPHTWYNVDNRDKNYWIGTLGVATNKVTKTEIKSGYYRNGNEFASSLTHQATRAFAHIPDISVKFTFVERADRIRMQIQNSDKNMVILSWELMEFLGFYQKLITTKEADLLASAAFDANRGLNLVYIYCDVASHVIVGDTKTPLLRVCNVTGRHGQVVRHTYERPHYVPVSRREFDSIEIAINNELGEPMPFQFGKSMVTLHFRPLQ